MRKQPDTEPYRLGGYQERAAPSDLARYVDRVWSYARSVDAAAIPGCGHRVLPECGPSLAFECHRDERGIVVDGRVLLMGPVLTPHLFAPDRGLHLEAVRLKPEWCLDLLGAHPADHADGIDDFRVVDAAAAGRILDRLRDTRSSGQAVRVLLDALRRRASELVESRSGALAHAGLEHIRATPRANVRPERAARELDVSARHLRRVIGDRTGMSPKGHHRIVRLGRVVTAADATGPSPDWSRLAVREGYYDQPHLIREFRSLIGRSPAETHRERALQTVRP